MGIVGAVPSAEKFLLERYRYVLARKESLNKATITIVGIYQAGLVVIVSGQFALLRAEVTNELPLAWVRNGSWALGMMLVVLSVFAILMLVGGIAAWLGYRKDEAEIEAAVWGAPRRLPRLGDVLRWYETYVALVVFVIGVCYFCLLYVYI